MGFYLMQEVTIDWYTHELSHPRCLGPCLHRIDVGRCAAIVIMLA